MRVFWDGVGWLDGVIGDRYGGRGRAAPRTVDVDSDGCPTVEGDPNYFVWFTYVDEGHDDNDSADVYFVPENYSTARGEARHGFWHVRRA